MIVSDSLFLGLRPSFVLSSRLILALVSTLSVLKFEQLTEALSAALTTTTRATRWGVRAARRFCCNSFFGVGIDG